MANTGSYNGSRGYDSYDPGDRFWTNDAPGLRNVSGGSSDHQGSDYGTRGATGVLTGSQRGQSDLNFGR